jgi:hypothetical protein
MTGAGHYRLAGQFAQQAHDRLKQEATQGALACSAIAQAYAALVNVPDSMREQAAKRQDPPDPEIRAVRRGGRGPGRAGKRTDRRARGAPD